MVGDFTEGSAELKELEEVPWDRVGCVKASLVVHGGPQNAWAAL